jgi:hypothetical protein
MSRVDSTGPSPDPLLGARLRDAPETTPSGPRISTLLAHASADLSSKGAQPWSRIEEKITAHIQPKPRLRWLWPAIATTSMMIATGAVAGPTLIRWVQSTPQVQMKPTASVVAPTPHAVVPTPAVDLPTSLKTAKLDAPLPRARAAVATLKTKQKLLAIAQPAKAEPPVPSTLAEESNLLGLALASLRKDKDAKRTLAILDDYQSRFPHGELSGEAQRTRVEAFMLQRRATEALAVLDLMSFATRARDSELRVVRGELRASAHRCGQARSDFSEALAVNERGPIAARALYGRASCLLELGDTQGAHAALLDYASRFPSGAHIAQVRKALDASAP